MRCALRSGTADASASWIIGIALAAGLALPTACTKDSAKSSEPVAPAPAPAPPEVPATASPLPDPCHKMTKLTGELPLYVTGKGVVVTRFMKPCVTREGERGVEGDSPWLAMGFPCTGGGGRIDIKGNNYNNPKMVSFILGTDCSMSPADKGTVDKMAREVLDLPADARLMAMTPFVVQYWEIPGMTDADTGFTVELRSAPALEGAWKNFREAQPLRVRLYGRENAWVQGGHFYAVEADLRITDRRAFRLEVASVKSLTPAEIGDVRARCDALKPPRSCADVF